MQLFINDKQWSNNNVVRIFFVSTIYQGWKVGKLCYDVKKEMGWNKIVFFRFNPLRRSASCVISKKKVKIAIFKILSHMVALSRNSEKTEDITTFAYYGEYS